jgi:hypothetical protein
MELNGIIRFYTCENATTIPNTAFVTSSSSAGEVESLSRLLYISATNIPPNHPQLAVAVMSFRDSTSVPSSRTNSPRKIS